MYGNTRKCRNFSEVARFQGRKMTRVEEFEWEIGRQGDRETGRMGVLYSKKLDFGYILV